jgi:hypothetical protein
VSPSRRIGTALSRPRAVIGHARVSHSGPGRSASRCSTAYVVRGRSGRWESELPSSPATARGRLGWQPKVRFSVTRLIVLLRMTLAGHFILSSFEQPRGTFHPFLDEHVAQGLSSRWKRAPDLEDQRDRPVEDRFLDG